MKWICIIILLLYSSCALAFTDPDSTPQSIQKRNFSQSLQDAKPLFTKWFNVTVVSDDDVMQTERDLVNEYHQHLKHCEQGTYKFPVQNILAGHSINNHIEPAFLLNIATVKRLSDNTCEVITTEEAKVPVQGQCDFTPDSLIAVSKPVSDSLYPSGGSAPIGEVAKARHQCHPIYSVRTDPFSNSQREFLNKFKQCVPGAYLVGDKKVMLSGYQDNKCGYKSVMNLDGKDVVVNCKFSQASLNVLASNKLAQLDGHPKFFETLSDADKAAMMQNNQECDGPSNPF
jgi:hypothetical protein